MWCTLNICFAPHITHRRLSRASTFGLARRNRDPYFCGRPPFQRQCLLPVHHGCLRPLWCSDILRLRSCSISGSLDLPGTEPFRPLFHEGLPLLFRRLLSATRSCHNLLFTRTFTILAVCHSVVCPNDQQSLHPRFFKSASI